MEYTLQIQHLKTQFQTSKGISPVVDDVTIDIPKGKIVGLVGESGCGKSMTAMSVMQLVKKPGKIVDGKVMLMGRNLLEASEKEMRNVRGNEISMIFQEPMTSLNPVYTVGKQVREAILLHQNLSKEEAKNKVIDIFRKIGIPEPEKRYNSYPHQLSGGLRQRVMIGMAMVCEPELLIADEPTTALDSTLQAQVLDLFKSINEKTGVSIVIISHDLGVIRKYCHRIAVMYAGQILESAPADEIFENARHPYTKALIRVIPSLNIKKDERLMEIPGFVPEKNRERKECIFKKRCSEADERCNGDVKESTEGLHYCKCSKYCGGEV